MHFKDQKSDLLSLLRSIPKNSESPKFFENEANALKSYEDATLMLFLEQLGVISIHHDAGVGTSIKASSESAHTFIQSLAQYVDKERYVFEDWTRKVPQNGVSSIRPLNGPRIALALEEERERWDNPTSLRSSTVVHALISARFHLIPGRRFLVKYDEDAAEFQLIGGHVRDNDHSPADALHREIEEEIGHFQIATTLNINLISKVVVKRISKTHAALTTYDCHLFNVRFSSQNSKLAANERWVTESELKSGVTKSDVTINSSSILQACIQNANLFLECDDSFSEKLWPSISLLKESTWQSKLWAALALLGIPSSIVGVQQFFG